MQRTSLTIDSELDCLLHKRVEKLMGNKFEISVVSNSSEQADMSLQAAVDEIKRIEKLLTTFDESSQTNLINRSAGISPVQVDLEVYELIERSIRISHLTQGAFDITYGSIDRRFWNFDLSMKKLPTKEEARSLVRLINYKNIILNKNEHTVFLKEKGMCIGFGGIGKGYAAEKAKDLLKSKGVKNGIVNAAGDLTTWGKLPNGNPFTVGIANPSMADHPFAYFEISDLAIATSGNYEKYVVIDDKRYSHTINPRTGFPVSGIKSVSIICANAEIADALATPVMVMGIHAGLDMVNQIQGVECIIIDDNNRLYCSNKIKIEDKDEKH